LRAELEGELARGRWLIEPVDTDRHMGGREYTHREDYTNLTTATVELLKGQLEEKDRQIAELHVLLREAQGQLKGLLPAPQGEEQQWERGKKGRRWWWPF
jgi:hypothetical protein